MIRCAVDFHFLNDRHARDEEMKDNRGIMDENEKVVTGKSEESFKVFLRFHPRASTCALLKLDGVHHCYVYTSYTKYAPHHSLLVESLSFECGKLTNNFTNPTQCR